jgi:acetyltransferase-like isoleucine patch superfamily enzyme
MTRSSIPQRSKGWLVSGLLRLSGAKVGVRMRIEGRLPSVSNQGFMELGQDIKFRIEGRSQTTLKTAAGATLFIGDGTFINAGVSIAASKKVTIGSHCLIGDNVQIHDSDYHQVEPSAPVRVLPVTIGKNVWIGRNAIILPGVSIGDHSVIGGGSVVTKSVPPKAIYAGVPARLIRTIDADERFVRR